MSNYYQDNKDKHMEIMNFIKKYNLKGKTMAEAEIIMDEVKNGRIQLAPVKLTKGTLSETKRGRDSYLGIRYIVKEIGNMPHILNTAYQRSLDNFFVEYLYTRTDLSKKELAFLLGFPVKTLNNKIDRYQWTKKYPLIRVGSTNAIIELIYRDPGEMIVVPDKEEVQNVDERYRQEFYKLGVRIKQAINMPVPDKAFLGGMNNAVTALRNVYMMERDVNRIMSEKDKRDIEIKQGKLDLEKSRIDGGFGNITAIELDGEYDRGTQALMFFLKETMGEKGIPMEKADEIMNSLASRLQEVMGDDEDEEE